jgi:agmatine/peptidylarginine deiminase
MVPIFGHRNDKVALRIIQEAFPEREVVGINCREVVQGLGTVHCYLPAAADGVMGHTAFGEAARLLM